MPVWTLLDYVSPAGNNLIKKWRSDLSPVELQEIDTLLGIMAKQQQWGFPEFKKIQGYKYLGEIRLKSSERRQLRIVGYQPRDRVYTLLLGCMHKGRVYDPPDSFDTAEKRRKKIESGEAQAYEHDESIE